MTVECVYCNKFLICQESIKAFQIISEKYPGKSPEVGMKRMEYMHEKFKDCKQFEEMNV